MPIFCQGFFKITVYRHHDISVFNIEKGANTYAFFDKRSYNKRIFYVTYGFTSKSFDLGMVWYYNRRLFNFKRANKAWIAE
ncbi:MAG: hypothetical protein DRH93_03670 [Deltaproteobacteria bacterium]|nr:MAG: hypothetical protein DRH93_03670 [Deltaproteobacteria bacterium]